MADCRHKFRFQPVHFNFMSNIAEDGYGSQEVILQDHGRKVDEHDTSILQIKLFGEGLTIIRSWGIRPVTDRLHP